MDQSYNSLDMVLSGETPALQCITMHNREEQRVWTISHSNNDVERTNPPGILPTDAARGERDTLRCTKVFKIGTWNVNGLNSGKLEIVKKEMERLGINILRISEVHWRGNGFFNSDDHIVYYSGNDNVSRRGVGFILTKKFAKTVESYRYLNDRIMAINIRGKPRNITIIQVYAPTAAASEEESNEFYEGLRMFLDETPQKDIIYIIGDFNAKVGEMPEAQIVGDFGLGVRNEAGDQLVQFCQENKLRITNTWFQQPKRRLYTWIMPGDLHRNQIDFILCQQRWKSSVLSVKTFPGADCGTDHQLLVAKLKLRLCNVKRPTAIQKFDTDRIPPEYAVEIKNRFDLLHITEDKEPEKLWAEMKNAIIETAQEHVPCKKATRSARWISEATIAIAEKRRKAKAMGDRKEVQKLNAVFQREARKDKHRFWNEQCEKMEEAQRKGRMRELYEHVKKVRTPFTARRALIRNSDGKELHYQQAIRDRWREYTEQLYANYNQSDYPNVEGPLEMEPNILEEEVMWAVKQLASCKAPGIDGIPSELLKPLPAKALTALCQSIWKTQKWPKEWKKSVFVPIHKKGDATNCENYRTIALIPHISKILLKIIQNRLNIIVDREMPEEQAGFRKERSTRDHIAKLRWIIEKYREYQKELYICFIDYSKAFDTVEHETLWKCFHEMGTPKHLIELIRSLYHNQEATVRTAFGDTDWFNIRKGIRQGCILSPLSFNLYAEDVMRRAGLDKSDIGIKIGGRNINNLRFADDTTLLAESKKDLEKLLLRVKEESEKVGLKLNIKKTKIVTTAANKSISMKINGEEIEVVDSFVFLGSKINCNADCSPEIKRRLAIGRDALIGMNKIWQSKDISLATKYRLVNAIIFPIVTYGSETWTVKKADRKKIDAFELWCWRRLLRIPWTAKITNREVLDRVKPLISLEAKVTKHRLSYFGHIMRRYSLEKDVMLGVVSGKRGRGRPRLRWMDIIKADTGMSIAKLKEAVRDRKGWRTMIHQVTETRNRLNG